MSTSDGIVSATLAFAAEHLALLVLLGPVIILILRSSYRISPAHPLFHIPGPLVCKITSLWQNYHAYIGDEASSVQKLHDKYGPVVQTGPSSVDISDGAALQSIYVEKGGFHKPAFYGNFDIDGHKSIFSEIVPKTRAPRAKAVTPIFSTANLRNGNEAINEAVDAFVDRVRRETKRAKSTKSAGATIDMLSLCRALAIDVVTGYLFGKRYGGCDEDFERPGSDKSESVPQTGEHMTASAMVDSFVAVGKFWYLPQPTFQMVEKVQNFFYPDPQAEQSIRQVDDFVAGVVDSAREQKDTNAEKNTSPNYPLRLLQADFTESEVRAQCKDLIFAGTDSTAMNLATIFFYLSRQPLTYAELKAEIAETNPSFDELQSLPVLRGVVREGLRMSMANPSRLPRLVPSNGWTFRDTFIPGETVVSCTPYSLHFNPDVYADPLAFRPDRWFSSESDSDSARDELMTRDFIPFGLGSRQCIARNLATVELFCAVKRVVQEGVLEQLQGVGTKIEIKEWFNSHVKDGSINMKVLS